LQNDGANAEQSAGRQKNVAPPRTVPSLTLQAAPHRGAAASARFEIGGSGLKSIVKIT
jgi:hypothetical protein